jgi:hypothetical protein
VVADCRGRSGEKLEEEDRNLAIQGKRKKMELDGGSKNLNGDEKIGSGMEEAAEQPRRLQ